LIAPVGALVLRQSGIEDGMRVLDVGTGTGGNIAIPAARLGARVVGADVTPELFAIARRRADAAGVEIEWLEADAQDLPLADESFDRVFSTFGAMFAPDHARAAAELVRVCAPGGRVAMTTWVNDGFAGELFKLTGAFMPPPPPGVQPPPLWGTPDHIEQMFAAADARPSVTTEHVVFEFPSVDAAVKSYTEEFGPFVMARRVLEPQGRWDEFVSAFSELVRRFDIASDGTTAIDSSYFVITVNR
jgi:SAM-dependent methyltransferase